MSRIGRAGMIILMGWCVSACSLRSLDGLSAGALVDAAPPHLDAPDVSVSSYHPDAAAMTRGDSAAPPISNPVAPPDAATALAFDAPGVPASGEPSVYFVVGNVPPDPADEAIARRLQDRQLGVVLVDDDRLLTVDTTSAALVLISSTTNSSKIGSRFRDVPQPVMLSEPLLYDDMGMVNARLVTNRGTEPAATAVHVDNNSSPLAAGHSGTVEVLSMPAEMTWGQPGPSAVAVASIGDKPTLIAIFSYEKGAVMPELVAPARRVAFFLSLQTASYLTPGGQAMFDAAVDWALGR
jgi:hypothetical protein